MWRVVTALDTIVIKIIIIKIKGFSCIEPKKIKIVHGSIFLPVSANKFRTVTPQQFRTH